MKTMIIMFFGIFAICWMDDDNKTWKEYLVGLLFLFAIIYIKKMGVI